MEYQRTPSFTSCIRCLLRKKASLPRASQDISLTSWPRKANGHREDGDEVEDDVALMFEEKQYQIIRVSQDRSERLNTSRVSTRRRDALKLPPWCRLPSSARYTILLITLLLLATVSHAAPLQHEHHFGLVERQSVPDQFGNTGNKPAAGGIAASPSRIATSTATSSRIVPLPSTVSTETLSNSVAQSANPTSTSTISVIPTTPTRSLPIPIDTTSTSSSTPSIIVSPTGTNPENQLQRIEPQNPLSPAAITGITLSSVIVVGFVIGTLFILHRRKKAREIKEIAIRRSKLGTTLAGRVFGSHYNDNIARSRSKRLKRNKFMANNDTVASWGNFAQDFMKPTPPSIIVEKPPVSPSIYSPRPLTRATRLSAMTFGSGSGWSENTGMGRPKPAVFTGTPSQLLDAPRPLFAQEQKRSNEGIRRGDISPPRPLRPGSAEPLGRLSGMGFGLGLR